MYFEWGEVITCMRHRRATEFVTSDEMTLLEFYGVIILFRNEIQYFVCIFNQNYSENSFKICDKQIITWDWPWPLVSTLDHYQPSSKRSRA